MTAEDLLTKFNTHEKCLKFLVKKRWGNIPKCTHCGSSKAYKKKNRYTCGGCGKSFSVLVGTIFESSKVPLNKWFFAILQILSAKKGLSSRQLARTIGVNKNTAWLMQFKVRTAMARDEQNTIKYISHHLKSKISYQNATIVRSLVHLNNIETLSIYIPKKISKLSERMLVGQFHKLSIPYFQGYLNELIFKQTHKAHRDNGFDKLLISCLNITLPFYKT